MSINIKTSANATLELQEMKIDSPDDFDPAQSRMVTATEPLALDAVQVYDYDTPLNAGKSTDATFSLYVVKAVADPAGHKAHPIQLDPGVTRIIYELANQSPRKRTKIAPTIDPGQTLYIWCSDHDRFPCSHPDCHLN
jgi:hypothetical protein